MSVLPLRSEDGALPILAEWKSAKALLNRLRLMAAAYLNAHDLELGEAALVLLKAQGMVEWSVRESDWASLQLCIVPSPSAWVYSGGECSVLPVGQLTFVNRRVLHSAVNFGNHPCIHLVVDVRKPDDRLDEPE